MKRIRLVLGLIALLVFSQSVFSQNNIDPNVKTLKIAQQEKIKNVEKVPNDPLNAVIYTLDNGLKVYMSVNKNEPRIQTYIAVRVGSKNDPKETTGLAHYFEHMMFKGTQHYGTSDWEKEKVLIQQIEDLYEIYRKETNKEKRDEIYKQIDKISYEASKLAIPNEYDKLMTLIGAEGTNAATSNDFTYYQENIPSNEIENWARIQSDRFTNPVLRLFHTELETIYEEKNMSLTNDGRKKNEAMMAALYPNHPYGTQTTLGLAEHLRNPSMTNIKNFFNKYYVPNNYCIAMSGDFNPEEAIKIIEKYFGKIPSKPVEPFKFEYEQPIKEVKTVDVTGLEAENLTIAYRINAGSSSRQAMLANLIDKVLNNGSCGIMDININQKQLASNTNSSVYDLNDYTAFMLSGTPKSGQSLDQLKELLLKQVEILKSGAWDESILKAAINNQKLQQIKELENNRSRAMKMAFSYLSNQPWKETVNEMDAMSKVTKEEILAFAKELFQDNNYVVVRKLQGEPTKIEKVEKPPITPIVVNRENQSKFFQEIKANKVKDIEPKFLDYEKDIQKSKLANSSQILYVPNKENKRFSLSFQYDFGKLSNKRLGLLLNYQRYLSTTTKSLEDLTRAFYNIACDYTIQPGPDYTRVTINGLSENLPQALALVEDILSNPKLDKEVVGNMVKSILKSRKDAKAKQNSCFSALNSYANYGKEQNFQDFISEKELNELTPEMLMNDLKEITKYTQEVWYYGDLSIKDIKTLLDKEHKSLVNKPLAKPNVKLIDYLPTKENKVYFVHYDAKQSYCRQLSTGGVYDEALRGNIALYNEYFGGSMNSIVFQEMREKRSLAYQAMARYNSPARLGMHYQNISHIATQNDKVIDAFSAFNELFDQMPVSQPNFDLAKNSMISSMRTNRDTRENIIYSYVSDRRMGRKVDGNIELYKKIPSITLNDVVNFNKKYIKGQPKTYIVLGNKNQVDLKGLEKFGKVEILSLEEIFGY